MQQIHGTVVSYRAKQRDSVAGNAEEIKTYVFIDNFLTCLDVKFGPLRSPK